VGSIFGGYFFLVLSGENRGSNIHREGGQFAGIKDSREDKLPEFKRLGTLVRKITPVISARYEFGFGCC
jgi:hypothetical protein